MKQQAGKRGGKVEREADLAQIMRNFEEEKKKESSGKKKRNGGNEKRCEVNSLEVFS